MPALDFTLPPVGTALRGGHENTAAAGAQDQAGEPFDQLMTRALSPAATGTTTEKSRTTSPAHGDEKAKRISSHPERQRVQAQKADDKKASDAAGETNAAPFPSANKTQDKAADSKTSDKKATDDSTSQSGTQVVAHVAPGVIIPLVAAPTPMVIPPSNPAAKKNDSVPAKTVPAATDASPARAVATALTETGNALTSGTEKKTSTSAAAEATDTSHVALQTQTSEPQASEKLIQSLKPDTAKKLEGMKKTDGTPTGGEPKTAAAIAGTAPGKTNVEAARTDSLPAGDVKLSELSNDGLPAPKSATEPPVHLPSNAFSKTADARAETSTATPPETHGTTVANLYSAMNKAEKNTKVAGQAEKVLPVAAGFKAKENFLPADSTLNGHSTTLDDSSPKDSLTVDAAAEASGVSASAMADMRSRALERTHDMVAVHAIRLGDTKAGSMHVVIKPGAGLQLSLDLQQHGEAIDARMNLERGDFNSLNQHWPELQQRLEDRGIRLAPLTGGENSVTSGGSGGFQQSSHKFASQDPDEAGAFSEFALANSILQPFAPATVFAAPGRGWETWA